MADSSFLPHKELHSLVDAQENFEAIEGRFWAQTGVGSATGFTAGSTAATFHSDDKYTGGTGTTGYTINGLVAALKNLGLLES